MGRRRRRWRRILPVHHKLGRRSGFVYDLMRRLASAGSSGEAAATLAGPFSPSSALWGKSVRKLRLPRHVNTARGTRARLTAAAAALAALCAGILAPAQPAAAASLVPISGAGSTWAYPAIHSWITSAAQGGITVNYTPNGSASGRSFFKAGLADWAQSEIPYGVQDGSSFDPPPARGYAYLPDLAGGTAFMYNLHMGG